MNHQRRPYTTLLTEKINAPLVVDLDGTLTPTDTLIESIIRLIRHHPLDGLRIPRWLLNGRAGFKAAVAARAGFSAETLPYRQPFLDYLRCEKQKGRQLILATAAHESIAESVALRLGLFDLVLASNRERNLKGRAKLSAIRLSVGDRFVYAGDSTADLAIWEAARGAVLVGASPRVARSVRQKTPVEMEFPRTAPGAQVWLRAMRVHQWLKNLLLFVPVLTSFSFLQIDKLLAAVLAFFAFSLAASATYLVNDLTDLENDRQHPRKKTRPFASARITIPAGLAAAGGLLAAALILAGAISAGFFLMLLFYLALASAYSWAFKKYVLVDVILLSFLYTLRILSGAVAIEVTTSFWLLAFSVFIFLSLALLKRCSELVSLRRTGRTAASGRDYRTSDLIILWPLGVGAALCAVVVLGLFISNPETSARYASPQLLWLVAFALIYWLSRLWIKTARGEMHDDPLIFAVKDSGSRITILVMLLITFAAHFLAIGQP